MSNTHIIQLEEYIKINAEVDRLNGKLKTAEAEIARRDVIIETLACDYTELHDYLEQVVDLKTMRVK